MNLSQFLLILQARYKIILVMLIVTVLTTLAVSLLMPKSYKATARVVVSYKGVDPVTGVSLPAQLLPGYMTTQVDIIKSQSVALKVVDELKLADKIELKKQFEKIDHGNGSIRDWLAGNLLKKLEVAPSHESNVIEIRITADNPQLASSYANAFVEAYQQTSIDLKVEPLKKVSYYFQDQIKLLRESFESAQRRLANFQREKGIVSSDNRYDIESSRLNELSAQLVVAQSQAIEASSRQKQIGTSPDVIANPLIHNLTAGLAAAESKFADISQKLGHNHPQYLGAKAEVDNLRSNLNNSVNAISGSVATNARILQQREAAIRSALAAQRSKVVEINGARSELVVYEKEAESAQRAYQTTAQRFIQANLEAQSNQSDVSILAAATPPLAPAAPKVLLNTLLSALVAVLLGIGFSLAVEMMDRRVRSTSDLVTALQAPVLGVMSWGPKPRRFLSSMLPASQRLLLH